MPRLSNSRPAGLVAAGCCGALIWSSSAPGDGSRGFATSLRAAGSKVSAHVLSSADFQVSASSGMSSQQSFGTPLAAGVLAVAAACVAGTTRSKAMKPTASRGTGVACRAEKPVLTLGTRGSPLALAQAYEAKRRLAEQFPELASDESVEIRIISTTGDQRLEISLSEIGGKGLFTRELDVALASKEVDFCVHSTKDVPTDLIPGTHLCTMLPREDTRDVLISGDPEKIKRIEDFPDGSLIGTASLRRQAQILAVNPTLKCVNFRGNVQTRLRKLAGGEVAGTFLAYAGLKRMSMEEHVTKIMEWDEMLPAISQGAISFQCRSDDERVLKYMEALNHENTFQAVTCERAFLAALDGNCKTPIAGQAKVEDGKIRFRGLVSSPDGKQMFRIERDGDASDAVALGRGAGQEVRKEAGEKFFEEMQAYVQLIQAANEKPVRG